MIKFSVSHSSILEKAGELEHEAVTMLHLEKIKRLLNNAGAEVIEVTRTNVMAKMSEDKFFDLFEIAEHELHGFFGFVRSINDVICKFINHLEHYCDDDSDGS